MIEFCFFFDRISNENGYNCFLKFKNVSRKKLLNVSKHAVFGFPV